MIGLIRLLSKQSTDKARLGYEELDLIIKKKVI